MPKNIVVYSDGTGQDGGVRPEQRISNVYKMYRASRVHPDNPIDPAQQVCFYDPGLGTDSGASGLTGIIVRYPASSAPKRWRERETPTPAPDVASRVLFGPGIASSEKVAKTNERNSIQFFYATGGQKL
jgi:hypothetical protein